MSETEISPELREILQPGNTVRIVHGLKNPNNRLVHIRAVVDEDYIVYSWWNIGRGWQYKLESIWYFYFCHKDGRLTLEKKESKA